MFAMSLVQNRREYNWKKKKKKEKKREREREGEKKSGLFLSVGGLLKDRTEM